jgi:WD40 repeat protein
MRIGAYDVEGEVGRGGMGVVLRGRAADGKTVAIKVLLRPGSDAAVARFERERRLLAGLGEAEGFVPLLDAGTSPRGPYFVMPYLPGGTLRARLEKGPLGIDETVALGVALAAALGRAHERAIVHRDLKPENILFTEPDGRGRALVADLGLAKHFARPEGAASVSLSKTGESKGTAGYVAPEQINDAKAVGPPADVFALGAILYECLAGREAFGGDGVHARLANLAAGRFEPLRKVRGDVPHWLAGVVERALAAGPEGRFPDGGALARALASRGAGERSRVVPALAGAAFVVAAGAAAFVFLGDRSRAGAPGPVDPSAAPAPLVPSSDPAPVANVGGPRKVKLRAARTLAASRWNREAQVQPWKRGGTGTFLGDGRVVTGAWDGVLRIWDPRTLEPASAVPLPYQEMGLLALRERGRLLIGEDAGAGAHPATIQELDVDAHGAGFTLKAPGGEGNVRRILATADERTIVFVSDKGTVSRWDISSVPPKNVWTVSVRFAPGPRSQSFGASLSPDEKLVAIGSSDGHVRVYGLEQGTLVHDWVASARGITYCLYTPDGAHLIAAAYSENRSGGDEILVLDSGTGAARSIPYAGEPFSLAVFPDSRTFATGADGVVDLWDLDSDHAAKRLLDRRARRSLPGDPELSRPDSSVVRELALSGDGTRLLGVLNDGCVDLWDVSGGLAPRKEDGPLDDPPRRLAVSADGRTALVAGGLGPIQVLSLASGRFTGVLPSPRRVSALAISPDGSRACSVDADGIVSTWDVTKRERLAGWPTHPPGAVAFADAEHIAVPDEEGTLGVQSWASLRPDPGRQGALEKSVLLTRVGAKDRLLTVSSGSAKVWKASTGVFLEELPRRTGKSRKDAPVAWAGFSGDGILVASAERVSLVKSLLASEPIWEASFAKEKVLALAASSDGAHVLIATDTGSLVLLDGKTGAEADRFAMASDAPTEIEAVPGAATFLVGTVNGGLFELEARSE